MSTIRKLYLALTILGAIVPWLYFGPWLVENSWDLGLMIDVWNANDATTGLVYDLTWSLLVLIVWVVIESVPRRDWLSIASLATGFMIGVSCALPLYLFLRSRPGFERD